MDESIKISYLVFLDLERNDFSNAKKYCNILIREDKLQFIIIKSRK